nr:rhomboid family intramembrane serine protease [Nannocystis pusilla]
MTTALIAVSAGWYAITLAAGWAGVGLLRAGALTGELWRAGSWGRLFTAPFVHADLLGLLLDCYSIWLAGHVLERIHGWARTGLIAILGSAAGMWAAAVADPDPAQVIGGGNALAVSVLVATLWTLLPARTPGLLSTVRRSVVLTLLFLLGAHVFACIPGVYGLRSTPLSLGTAAFVASVLTLLMPPTLPGWTRRPLAALCLAAIAVVGLGAVQVAREDPIAFAAAHRDRRVSENGVALALPASFERVEAEDRRHPLLKVFPGWLDTQALRGGYLVQFVVVPDAPAEGSALFALAPALARELVIRPEDAPAPAFAGFVNYTLQRNGETIARVVERRLGDHAVLLLAAPASALDPAPALYSAILGDAALADYIRWPRPRWTRRFSVTRPAERGHAGGAPRRRGAPRPRLPCPRAARHRSPVGRQRSGPVRADLPRPPRSRRRARDRRRRPVPRRPTATCPIWLDPGLWNFEVVELFLHAPDDRYLELEFGPHGHSLALQLHGVRNLVATVDVAFVAEPPANGRWRGRAVVSPDLLPPASPAGTPTRSTARARPAATSRPSPPPARARTSTARTSPARSTRPSCANCPYGHDATRMLFRTCAIEHVLKNMPRAQPAALRIASRNTASGWAPEIAARPSKMNSGTPRTPLRAACSASWRVCASSSASLVSRATSSAENPCGPAISASTAGSATFLPSRKYAPNSARDSARWLPRASAWRSSVCARSVG